MDRILAEINRDLDYDLRRMKIINTGDNKNDSDDKKRFDDFVRYLASVASHPIGLRASLRPYNVPQEHMLAYIMDIFNIDEIGLRKILVGREDRMKLKDDNNEGSHLIAARKLHSWRPELRVRLHPPKFFYKQNYYLSNLSVRVYLFKDQHETDTETDASSLVDKKPDDKSKGALNRIFRRFRVNPNALIRPINEMKALLRFSPPNNPDQLDQSNAMQIVDEGNSFGGDVHLNIRRYYCDPKSVHYVRFEFWLKAEDGRSNIFNRYRRFVKQFVYNGCNHCFRSKRSTYMNEDNDFYGYINLRTTQLTSYPTRENYSILSLDDRKINNCDISLEIKNRRLREEDERMMRYPLRRNSLQTRQFGQMYLTYQIRAMANFILTQCRDLNISLTKQSLTDPVVQDISLDNVLYLPAYSIINQNRLQSNISQYENRCLRRISMLLIIMKLDSIDQQSDEDKEKILNMVLVVISLIYSDYLTSHRSFDSVTLQEMDPFQDRAGSFAVKLEFMVLERFKMDFLERRLKSNLLFQQNKVTSLEHLNRLVTLKGLKMFETALSHFIKSPIINQINSLSIKEVSTLRASIRQLLTELIIAHIKKSLTSIMNAYAKTLDSSSTSELWLKFLHQMIHMDRDLNLSWSHKGLSGLFERERVLVERQFQNIDLSRLVKKIEEKLRNYLM